MLVLGSGWNSVIEALLGFRLAECLKNVSELRLEPTTPRLYEEESHVYCELASEFFCKSNEYEEFDSLVKTRFELRTSYDTKQQVVKFLDRKYFETRDESIISGREPKWLSWLLEHNAVDTLIVKYPYDRENNIGIKRVIRMILVFPDCPVPKTEDKSASVLEAGDKNAPVSKTEDRKDFIVEITDKLGVGAGPFYTVATEMNEAWVPFVSALIESRCDRVFGVAKDHELSCAKDYVLETLIRCFSFDIYPITRSGFETDYPVLAQYCFEQKNADNVVQYVGKDAFSLGEMKNLGETILSKVSRLEYLDCAINYFVENMHRLLNELGCQAPESATSVLPETAICLESVSRPSPSSPHSIALIPFSIFHEHLVTIQELKKVIEKWLATMDNERLAWLSLGSHEDMNGDLSVLTQTCCEVLLNTSNSDVRLNMLAALLYLYTNEDVLPDTEDHGLNDDLYVIASEIKSLESGEKVNIRNARASSLAADVIANRDAHMPSTLLQQAEARVREIKSVLKSLRKRKSRPIDADASS